MRDKGLSSSSLNSAIIFAVSLSRKGNTPRPHEPTIGLTTIGNPVFLIKLDKDSELNAKWVVGVGIFSLASLIEVNNLFPQISPTLKLLIAKKPKNSRQAVKYKPL